MTNNFRRFAFSKRGAFRLILFEIEVTKGIGANISIFIYIRFDLCRILYKLGFIVRDFIFFQIFDELSGEMKY